MKRIGNMVFHEKILRVTEKVRCRKYQFEYREIFLNKQYLSKFQHREDMATMYMVQN